MKDESAGVRKRLDIPSLSNPIFLEKFLDKTNAGKPMTETIKLLDPAQTLIEDLPFDQRSDVTVAELENESLPYPAELYDGRIIYKMANYEHAVLQAELIGELKIYLKKNPIGRVPGEANFRLWPDRGRESRIPDLAFT